MKVLKAPRTLATAAAIATAFAALALAGCSPAASASGDADAAGTWGKNGDNAPQLVLGDDGKLSGTDGCNRLMGSWELEGDTVKFGQVASTLMACEGVDTWLSALDSATVSGDTMTVLDSGGKKIGTLPRG